MAATRETNAISMRAVRRTFRAEDGTDVQALDGVDLEVQSGAFVAVIGPSGCGKSTLLRMAAGLDRPTEGTVDVAPVEIGYVFQDAQLLPWRTVAGNVALPLELRSVPPAERDAAVRRALSLVELAEAADRYPAALSGGMRMRASIARALVTRPRLLLMDEPFAALDELTRHRLDAGLRRLWQEHRFTVVFVTHAIFEAAFLAERAVVLSRRPGRIVHDGPVALPAERDDALRGTPAFAAAAADLLAALQEGSS